MFNCNLLYFLNKSNNLINFINGLFILNKIKYYKIFVIKGNESALLSKTPSIQSIKFSTLIKALAPSI